MKPIHDWCEERGWKITGHHVLEGNLLVTIDQQWCSHAAVSILYYSRHGLGYGRRIKPVTTPVQVASVCAQLGKKQILSETFAMCGWNVKLEELKWMCSMANGTRH